MASALRRSSAGRNGASGLPVVAADRSARFVSADPGRETDRELRRWADEQRAS